MDGGPGRVLVVAEGGHEPLVRALVAEGHEADGRLPAEALGPPPDVIVVVRADPAAAVLAALERRGGGAGAAGAGAGRAGDRAERRGAGEGPRVALARRRAHLPAGPGGPRRADGGG